MPYPFRQDRPYSRRDVYRMIGIPEDTKGGNWDTGYARFGEDFFVFCNVGTSGRTGHDYQNHWDGENLVWYAKNGTRRNQPTIQRITAPSSVVYLFWREDNQAPFSFAGLAHAESIEDTSPVRVTWSFTPVA
ncbi:MAG TPA: DUF3427 domain-containing protein [Longimicrobiaceae bacterium]|nr:DUF3427 domain-containing protein [Longimicrobiaceae bacterium]